MDLCTNTHTQPLKHMCLCLSLTSTHQPCTHQPRTRTARTHTHANIHSLSRKRRGWSRSFFFLSFFLIFFLSSLSHVTDSHIISFLSLVFSIFYIFCCFYLGCLYILVPSLSLCLRLCLTPASSVFLLPTTVTIVTITVTKTIFFSIRSQRRGKYDFLVICLYAYKRTRQLGEEQQVAVVECGRASAGAVS